MKVKTTALILFIMVLPFGFAIESPGDEICPNMLETQMESLTKSTDLAGVNVAIYEGEAGEAAIACRTAMFNMFLWMNASVDLVDAADVKGGALDDYDIIAMPPGNLPMYTVELGYDGLDAIRDFVRYGGSFLGISGGAIFACAEMVYGTTESEYLLELYNGTARGPVPSIPDQTIAEFNVNTSCVEVDLSGFPATLSSLHWGATYYTSDVMEGVITVATYQTNDASAMILFKYGTGCVFLTGLHPEFEEDSARDGTDYFDELSDPDSEWPLMMQCTNWMLENSEWTVPSTTSTTTSTTTTSSTTTSTTTTTTSTQNLLGDEAIPILLTLGGTLALVAIAVVVRKRS
ncbi:MAG: BPL-N domain-containing protein [Promethearchaeota archaeon]